VNAPAFIETTRGRVIDVLNASIGTELGAPQSSFKRLVLPPAELSIHQQVRLLATLPFRASELFPVNGN
jgi:hypothetical protein